MYPFPESPWQAARARAGSRHTSASSSLRTRIGLLCSSARARVIAVPCARGAGDVSSAGVRPETRSASIHGATCSNATRRTSAIPSSVRSGSMPVYCVFPCRTQSKLSVILCASNWSSFFQVADVPENIVTWIRCCVKLTRSRHRSAKSPPFPTDSACGPARSPHRDPNRLAEETDQATRPPSRSTSLAKAALGRGKYRRTHARQRSTDRCARYAFFHPRPKV